MNCKPSTRICSLLLLVSAQLFGAVALASENNALTCLVEGTDDRFELYPRQISYESARFLHYQLIEGLTVIVVNRKTLRFNRLSNLNLLEHSTLDPTRPAEPIQYFTGQCVASRTN